MMVPGGDGSTFDNDNDYLDSDKININSEHELTNQHPQARITASS
jgi:hypothetical protein